jgi:uncharacterized protein YbjT (DUF2867 family)
MNILLTGANGYIGKTLLPYLLNDGHIVYCCLRSGSKLKFINSKFNNNIKIVYVDFLERDTLANIPKEIDVAFYLIHSMSSAKGNFMEMERECALNFRESISKTNANQVIYLSGIVNDSILSKHLQSRKNVEDILANGRVPLTTLRAGIIVGNGSASFQIIQDLVKKLPVMITPKWVKTKTQPIALENVIQLLSGVMGMQWSYGISYDIAGPDILTYKQMLVEFAKITGKKRYILTVPVMTPRLSSYWLYFVTSTSYNLAQNLVDSMKVEVLAKESILANKLNITLLDYKESVLQSIKV